MLNSGRNPPQTMASLLEKNLILFGTDETTIPNRKYLLKENLTENVSSLYYMGSSDDELLKNNLIDDDQTLLLMSYLQRPEFFELHRVSDRDWFVAFKEFAE